MGYQSTVRLVAMMKTAENIDEVLAVYQMREDVMKHKLLDAWRRVNERDFSALIYEGDNVKFYDEYEDVKALRAMETVLGDFHDNRGMGYAWCEVRIGEEHADVVYSVTYGEDDDSRNLLWIMYDTVNLVQKIELYL